MPGEENGRAQRRVRLEMLALYARGYTLERVGGELGYSEPAVRWNLGQLKIELAAQGLPHAIAVAVCLGYLVADGRARVLFVPDDL